MVKINYLVFVLSLSICSCAPNMNPNYQDMEFVSIYNLFDNCRYCKKFIDENTYSYPQCSLLRDNSQRFHILKGSSSCNAYTFINAESVSNQMKYLKYNNIIDFEIIIVNDLGGVAIKVLNQNICLTNDPSDSIIPPFSVNQNQYFKLCLPYNSDGRQVFYFSSYIFEAVSTQNCKSETAAYTKFTFVKTSAANVPPNIPVPQDSTLLADNSNININGSLNYIKQVPNHAGLDPPITEFYFWVEIANGYTVSVTVANSFDYEQLALTNFDIVNNNQINVNINITEKINLVTFNFKNNLAPIETDPMTDVSFIASTNINFTRDYNSAIYSEVVPVVPSSNISIFLHHSKYSISTIDTDDWERKTNDVTILNYASTSFDIVMRQKILVTIKFFEQSKSTLITSRGFLLNSKITFTDNSTSEQFSYTIIDDLTTEFQQRMHIATYDVTATIYNSDYFENFPVQTVAIANNSNIVNINIIEKIKEVTFNLIDESNSNVSISSNVISSADITFTSTTIPAYVQTYTRGSSVTTFSKSLHYGLYDITLTLENIFNSKFYIFPALNISVSAISTTINIAINEIKAHFYFKYNGSFLNETSGLIEGTTYNNVSFVPDKPAGKSGDSVLIRYNNGLVTYRRDGWRNDPPYGPLGAPHSYLNEISIYVASPDSEFTTKFYTGFFYTNSSSGNFEFEICADDDGELKINGVQVLLRWGFTPGVLLCVTTSYNMVAETYYLFDYYYSNANATGETTLNFKIPGGSFQINGLNYYYNQTDSSFINLPGLTKTGDLTISLWIKTLRETGYIFQFGSTADSNRFGLYLNNSNVEVKNSGTTIPTSANITRLSWTHVIFSLYSGNMYRLCINLNCNDSGVFSVSNQYYDKNKLAIDSDTLTNSLAFHAHKFKSYPFDLNAAQRTSINAEV